MMGASDGALARPMGWTLPGAGAVMTCAMWLCKMQMASGNSLPEPSEAAKSARLIGEVVVDETLQRYRESIDNIDAALVFMLAERFKVTQSVGRYKATHQLPPADPGREESQIGRLRQLALDANLDPDFTEKFLRFIIDEVIRHHEKLRDA
jgi:chorismate mutase